jgi:hypothetical protein
MKLPVTFFLLSFALPMFSQAPLPETSAQNQVPVAEPAKPGDETPNQATEGSAQRSIIEVAPGPEAIKEKDLYEKTGIFHPLVRMPKYILQDQKAIWTSPFHTTKNDIKWWVLAGAATGALIATDQWTVKQLPNSSSQVSVSTWGSRLGSAYSLIPISAGFYFIGTGTHEERFRETGLLGFEALLDATVVVEAVKLVADRARPLESDGKGHFWALASVIAHQYPHPRIIPIVAYSLASIVVVARVGARQHFPGDAVAGSAMGWFIGDFVYGKRHNRDLDQKPTFAQRVMDHVRIGGEIQ